MFFFVLLMLFTLQERISTMGNKNILLYIPTEGQETIIFLSVTSPASFLKYSPEIMRSYFFPKLSRKNANIKSVKTACNCNFYSTDLHFYINYWYVWLYVLCCAGLWNKMVGVASLNAKWRKQILGGCSPVLFNSIFIKGGVMSPITL